MLLVSLNCQFLIAPFGFEGFQTGSSDDLGVKKG